MLSMISEQVEVAQFEAFVKARDATVLADATLKGVLPLARACRITVNVENGDAGAYSLAAGRRLVDPKGRLFVVDVTTTIAPGDIASVPCTQKVARIVPITVNNPQPYQRVQVLPSDDDTYLNTLAVYKGSSEMTYAPDWHNVEPNQLAYQVETDERRRLWVCFGAKDIVGYGVQAGDKFELRLTECEGKINDLQPDAPFALEYAYTPSDGKLTLLLGSVTDEGAAPHTMTDLRVMARYPSIYDHNAVYLGEFDFLLRRYMAGIRFLSVWNEQIEEEVRGASVDNINRLFVSGLVQGMTKVAFEARVTELIERADDSYKLVFVDADVEYAGVTVTAKVAAVHDPATVQAQVRAAILGAYGDGTPDVARGMSNPIRVQPINALLKAQVPAFQDSMSDFTVTVTLPESPLPEHFLFVSPDSLTVVVTLADYNNGLWNY